MNKLIEIQAFKTAKKQKCNLCDRQEIIEKRVVFWQESNVVGDLLLCNSCLEIVASLNKNNEQVLEEWIFGGGNENGKHNAGNR